MATQKLYYCPGNNITSNEERLAEPRAQVIIDELVFHRDAGCTEARAKQQNQTDDI